MRALQYEVYGVAAPKVLYSLHSPISTHLHAINDLDAHIASEHESIRRYRQAHAWNRTSADKSLPWKHPAGGDAHLATTAPARLQQQQPLGNGHPADSDPPTSAPSGTAYLRGDVKDGARAPTSHARAPGAAVGSRGGTVRDAKQGAQRVKVPRLAAALVEVHTALDCGNEARAAALVVDMLHVCVVRNQALTLAGIERLLDQLQLLPFSLQVRALLWLGLCSVQLRVQIQCRPRLQNRVERAGSQALASDDGTVSLDLQSQRACVDLVHIVSKACRRVLFCWWQTSSPAVCLVRLGKHQLDLPPALALERPEE